MINQLIETLKRMNKESFTKDEILFFLEKKYLEQQEQDEPIVADGIILKPREYEVLVDDKRHIFPKKEFKVLHYLISNPNKCITRRSILKNCWEDGVIVCDRTIDVHICKIKKKLKGKINIYTQKGVGYKWKVQ